MNKAPHLMTVLHVTTEVKKSLESDDSATPRKSRVVAKVCKPNCAIKHT
jgi:hypothetical protein